MPTIQISKIQMRRGPASDLPNPSLDNGEFGFTTDTGRLFIGQSTPTNGQPNYNRSAFPYHNVEVLTENSPLNAILGPVVADNQDGFTASVPLNANASTFTTFQVYDSTGSPENFNVDLWAFGANATIYYFEYDASNNPLRVGRLHVIWNTNMVGSPLCTDEADVAVGSSTDLQWTAVLVGSIGNQHVNLQYKNARSDTPTVYFRIDRPALP